MQRVYSNLELLKINKLIKKNVGFILAPCVLYFICSPILLFFLVFSEEWVFALLSFIGSIVCVLLSVNVCKIITKLWLIIHKRNNFASLVESTLLTNGNIKVIEEQFFLPLEESEIKKSAEKLYKSLDDASSEKSFKDASLVYALLIFLCFGANFRENYSLVGYIYFENPFHNFLINLGAIAFCVLLYFLHFHISIFLFELISKNCRKKILRYKELNPTDPRNKYL